MRWVSLSSLLTIFWTGSFCAFGQGGASRPGPAEERGGERVHKVDVVKGDDGKAGAAKGQPDLQQLPPLWKGGKWVVTELAAKGKATGAVPEAIVFDGPLGGGRRGAKGVLLRNESHAWQRGSTWTFRYSRDGTPYGVEIFHPYKEGQVMVHL